MTTVHKFQVLNYTAKQMYDLVSDVECYPDFLPWCERGQVIATDKPYTFLATIAVCVCGIRQQFSTQNTHVENKSITMQLMNGPFKRLHGQWRFIALSENQCRVELDLDYEFSQFIFEKLVGPMFEVASASMVTAFCERARKIYG